MSLRRVKRSSTVFRRSRSDFRMLSDWLSTSESGYEEIDDGNARSDIASDLRSIGNKYDKLVLKMFSQRSNVRSDFQLLRKEAKSLRNELKFLIMKHDGSTAFKKGYKPESHEVERVVKAEVVTKEMGQLEMALADLMAKYYYLLEQTKTLKDINSLWHIRSVMRSDLLKRGMKIARDEPGAFRSDLTSPIVNKDVDDIRSENNILIQKVRWLNKLSQEFRADLSELISAKVTLLNGKVSLEKQYGLGDANEIANNAWASEKENCTEDLRETESRIIDGLKRRIAALDRISDALKVAMLKVGFKDLKNEMVGDSEVNAAKKSTDNSFHVNQIVETGYISRKIDSISKHVECNGEATTSRKNYDPIKSQNSYDPGEDILDDDGETEEVQLRYIRIEDVDENDLQCLSPKSKRRFKLFSNEGAIYGDLSKYPKNPKFGSDDNFDKEGVIVNDAPVVHSNDKKTLDEEEFFDAEESFSESRSLWCNSEKAGVNRSDSDVTLTEEMNIPCMELTAESRASGEMDTGKQGSFDRDFGVAEAELDRNCSDYSSLVNDKENQGIGNNTVGRKQANEEVFTQCATRQDRFAVAKNYFISYCYSEGKTEAENGDDSTENNASNSLPITPETEETVEIQRRASRRVLTDSQLGGLERPSSVLSVTKSVEIGLKDSENPKREVRISASDSKLKQRFENDGEVKRAVSVLPTFTVKPERRLSHEGKTENDKSSNHSVSKEDALTTEPFAKRDRVKRSNSVLATINLFEDKTKDSGRVIKGKELKITLKEYDKGQNDEDQEGGKETVLASKKLETDDLSDGKMMQQRERKQPMQDYEVITGRENISSAGYPAGTAQSSSSVDESKKVLSHEDRPVLYNPDGNWQYTPKLYRSKSALKSRTLDRSTRQKNTKSMLETAANKTGSRGNGKTDDYASSTLPRSLKASQSPKKVANPRSVESKVRPRSTVLGSQQQKDIASNTLPRNMKSRAVENKSSGAGRPKSRVGNQLNASFPSGTSKVTSSTAASKPKAPENNNVCSTLPRGMKIGRKESRGRYDSVAADSRPASRLRRPTTPGAQIPMEKRMNGVSVRSDLRNTQRENADGSDKIIAAAAPSRAVGAVDTRDDKSDIPTEAEFLFDRADEAKPEETCPEPRNSWVIVESQLSKTIEDAVTVEQLTTPRKTSQQSSLDSEQNNANITNSTMPRKTKSTSDTPFVSAVGGKNSAIESGIASNKYYSLPRPSKPESLDENLNLQSQNEADGTEKKKKRKLVIKKRRPNSTTSSKNKNSETKPHEDKKHLSKVDFITGKAASWMHSAFKFVSSDAKHHSKSSSKVPAISPVKTSPECQVTIPEDITRSVSSRSSNNSRSSTEYRKSFIPVPTPV